MPTPRHRALRHRSLIVSVLLVLLGSVILTVASPGGPPFASAATEVPKSTCKKFDPNLVNGMCLKYAAKSGTGYTWIGSYKADNGKVFFCIDYLYDSRIVSSASVVDTDPLTNQLGKRIGAAEVAALNYLISTWAPHGSTGSDQRDAAIALIIREVMSDAVRPDGTVVYKPGLKVNATVAAPSGGMSGGMLRTAQSMWRDASRYRGPGTLVLKGAKSGQLELGETEAYQLSVMSASHRPIPGLKVTLTCTGPITCPRSVTTKTTAVTVKVTPTAVGKASIKATTSTPSGNGKLLRLDGWRTHGGSTAADNGVQRGWIGQRNRTAAAATVEAEIVKGTPRVTTRTSSATVLPGTALADLVTVAGLPAGSRQQVTATLYGPFQSQPGPDSCTAGAKEGEVTFPVDKNGTFTTPGIDIEEPGYYVWTESMPGDDLTNPVTTPCGIAEETTIVDRPKTRAPRTPTVHTVASAHRLLVGSPIRDLVVIKGLSPDTPVAVEWRLLGPIAPRHGSCLGLDWRHAKTVAAGTLRVTHDGRYTTEPVTVGAPGCVTYTEHVAATASTTAVNTKPGEAAETALVTRRPVPVVPEIPSGPAGGGRR